MVSYEEQIDFVIKELQEYPSTYFGYRSFKDYNGKEVFELNIVHQEKFNDFQKQLILSFFTEYFNLTLIVRNKNKDHLNFDKMFIKNMMLKNYFEIK